ncbi:Uu.00g130130.m01.CDS01 [Anthostomella pinea]|uniref:Uu.00g130130.m01.CDS01 n=1 Tax=Anthostomella pinea TaxID=933095 RepID=A0AAI8VJR8_9PEZI|nr:Uu.00g130130.m01.CDS01 [Anthostomella pinea]
MASDQGAFQLKEHGSQSFDTRPTQQQGTPFQGNIEPNPVQSAQDALYNMANTMREVHNLLAQHQCDQVSIHLTWWKQAYQQEVEKLNHALEINNALARNLEKLRSERDYFRDEAARHRENAQSAVSTAAAIAARIELLQREKHDTNDRPIAAVDDAQVDNLRRQVEPFQATL